MNIISYETLQQHVGGRTPAEVAAKLSAVGIRYLKGKGGKPWTTIESINWALGIHQNYQPTAKQLEIEIA